jgi:hypothetical protein
MKGPPEQPSPEESNRLLLERIAEAADAESLVARARAWSNRPMEEHAAELARALALADAIVRGRGFPARKPPLPVIQVREGPWRPQ